MRMVQGQTPNIVERQSSSRKSIFSWSRIFFSRIKKSSSESNSLAQQTDLQRISETQEVSPTGSYLVDAFICEPIPYRTAINDNCTHIGLLFYSLEFSFISCSCLTN